MILRIIGLLCVLQTTLMLPHPTGKNGATDRDGRRQHCCLLLLARWLRMIFDHCLSVLSKTSLIGARRRKQERPEVEGSVKPRLVPMAGRMI
jgi:hypothetical protein